MSDLIPLRLCKFDHLLRQFHVGLCPPAPRRVVDHRLPVDGGLREPDSPRDDGLEDVPREVGSDLVGDLRREARPRVVHCEDDAERAKGRVEHLPHELQSAPELPQPVERVVLTLDRYENAIGRG